ncbi:heat shock protein 70 (Hsp 70) family protein [Zea mays]|nr:heat shock protein 70 (Hsp 70) family protein [Zea mays]
MVKEAELHAQKDQERKSPSDLKNSADTTIYTIEKSVSEYKDKVPAEVTKEIESAVSDLRAAMAEEDLDKIKQKLEAANKAVSKIGEHMQQGHRVVVAALSAVSGGNQTPQAEYKGSQDVG